MKNRKELLKKWAPVLEHAGIPAIKNQYRKEITAILLENQEGEIAKKAGLLQEAAPTNSSGSYPDSGGMAVYDPVLISLVRRAMPQLIAYDVASVQPMTQPVGLAFALKSRYNTMNGTEALYNEPDTSFSGTGTASGSNPVDTPYSTGTAMPTGTAEGLGSSGGATFNQMAFSIEKVTLSAQSRGLKAEYSLELKQDMQSVHGLDADALLGDILATEILAEINREVIRTIYSTAKTGAQTGTATAGVFDLDVDSNGRWMLEKFKGLLFQIEREANAIAHDTRMGRGNFLICAPDVASALAMSGKLDYTPALQTDLNVDVASSTFAGVLNGRFRVFVDPYMPIVSNKQWVLVGYKGENPLSGGLIYAPYIPLEIVRAVDPNTMNPKLGYKTRYALAANPFISLDSGSQTLTANTNYWFRMVQVANLM